MQAAAIDDGLSSPSQISPTAGRWLRRLPWMMVGLNLPLAVAIVMLAILTRQSPDAFKIEDPYVALGGLVYTVVGALIATRQSRNSLGWLFLAMGVFGQVGSVLAGWAVYSLETNPSLPLGDWALWIDVWISVSMFMPMFPLLLFPNGRLEDRKTRFVAGLTVLSTIWLVAALLIGTTVPPGFPAIYAQTPNPLFSGDPPLDAGLGIIALGICGLFAVGLVLWRFRKSSGVLREQYMWIVLDMCLLVLAFVGDFIARGIVGQGYQVTTPLMNLSMSLLPVAVGIAILQHRLFDIELIFSRAIVYALLSVCVVGIYVLVVGWMGTAFRSGGNLAFSLLATGIVAVLFHPMREVFQRKVNRVLFGDRDDPYAVISRLGEKLENTLAVDSILPAVAATVREALRLPYAAVSVTWGSGEPLLVESGCAASSQERLPLLYRHEQMGELLFAPRTPGDEFGPADRRLLDDLARQAGIAVHAVRLTHELQRARERLVEAREEERRRLHRDLHDGLGSQLAALNLQLGAMPALIDSDRAAARDEVAELRTQLRSAITSVRSIVQGLRPPAIDELGLLVALRERIRQFNTDGFVIKMDLPSELPELAAAVEVAVYRVTEEALANVTKHAQARWCFVRLSFEDASLVLRVEDDGVGPASRSGFGVGLRSMRERAEELGGQFTVDARSGGGTMIEARFGLDRVGADRA